MIIKPMNDNVLIRMTDTDPATKYGIILPSSVREKPVIAEVLSVGTGLMEDGSLVDMQVSIGDKVLINKYAGDKFMAGDEEITILKMKDIIAIVEEDDE